MHKIAQQWKSQSAALSLSISSAVLVVFTTSTHNDTPGIFTPTRTAPTSAAWATIVSPPRTWHRSGYRIVRPGYAQFLSWLSSCKSFVAKTVNGIDDWLLSSWQQQWKRAEPKIHRHRSAELRCCALHALMHDLKAFPNATEALLLFGTRPLVDFENSPEMNPGKNETTTTNKLRMIILINRSTTHACTGT